MGHQALTWDTKLQLWTPSFNLGQWILSWDIIRFQNYFSQVEEKISNPGKIFFPGFSCVIQAWQAFENCTFFYNGILWENRCALTFWFIIQNRLNFEHPSDFFKTQEWILNMTSQFQILQCCDWVTAELFWAAWISKKSENLIFVISEIFFN